MLTIQFFTRQECTLCESALAVVRRVQKKIPFSVEIVDIDSNPSYASLYGNAIPVITLNQTEIARSFVEEKQLLNALRSVEKSLKNRRDEDA